MIPELYNPKFGAVAYRFELACAASRQHDMLAAAALKKYGEHGPQVSGCVRSHFPDDLKDELRAAAREVSRQSDLAHANRPKRVRTATIRAIGRAVATRDGSGFYGPQPIQSAAATLWREVRTLSAWNMPDRLRAQLKRTNRNQHGTRYTFTDGSAAFVPAGSATVKVEG